jgi:DNA repair exonuclease SbcCD ATPase subunit
MSEDDLVTLSIRVYRWQKELLEKQPINKSQLIRDLLTQYFKGETVKSSERRRVLIEEAKELIKEAESKKSDFKAMIEQTKEEILKFTQAKLEQLDKFYKEYESLIEKAKEKVKEAEELDKVMVTIKQEEEDSELMELIEEVFKPALEHPRGVDGWAEEMGVHTLKVRFEKLLPNMARERGIKLNLRKAKEIIEKYYPEIAKYLS